MWLFPTLVLFSGFWGFTLNHQHQCPSYMLQCFENAVNYRCSKRPNVERLSLPLKKKMTLMPRMEFGGSASGVGASKAAEGEIVWIGQLCLHSTTVSDVEMVSFSTFNLPWLLWVVFSNTALDLVCRVVFSDHVSFLSLMYNSLFGYWILWFLLILFVVYADAFINMYVAGIWSYQGYSRSGGNLHNLYHIFFTELFKQ